MACLGKAAIGVALAGVMTLAGCGLRRVGTNSDSGEGGTLTTGEGGDLWVGGGGAAPICGGACVASAAGPFVRITMVSIGEPKKVKPCPEWAPEVGFEGFTGMTVAPHTCPTCSCGPAACALPTELFASAAKCAEAESATFIEWDAPPAWEGVCTAEFPIAPGLQCAGAACVQSLTIDAPTIEPCKVAQEGIANIPDPEWNLMARECTIDVDVEGAGCSAGKSCAPVPPQGFALCLSVAGDDSGYECPKGYPDRFVVFDGVNDSRQCSPCSCSEQQGADCAALVSAFTDNSCGALLGSYMLTNDEPGCFDLPSGSALGSKSAKLVVDKPGSCAQSGGDASGVIQPAGPVTLCCQQSDPDPPK